jgi:dsRNA-specific ribonuclease
MKGRARQKNAKFFVFHDATGTEKTALPLSMAQEMERRVHDFIQQKSRAKTPLSESQQRDDGSERRTELLPTERGALEDGYFRVEHGTVDLLSAKSLLNRYAMSVPLDPFARTSKDSLLAHMPVYYGDRLVLPSHLPRKNRTVALPEYYLHLPKKEKHKLLSLMACVRLHSFGLLNDRLLPLNRKDMQGHILRVATKQIQAISEQRLPLEKFFKDGPSEVYVYAMNLKSPSFGRLEKVLKGKGHKLALVTFEPIAVNIPPFKLRHTEFGVVTASLGEMSVLVCSQEQRAILSKTFILLMNERWRRRSRNMHFKLREEAEYLSGILPYLLGIISSEGRMDWDFMSLLLKEAARSKEERTDAVAKVSSILPLAEPRLWAPLYDEPISYISFGPSGETCATKFPHEKEGVETYQDYFQIYREFELPAESPLFDVQRLWSLPSNLPILGKNDDTIAIPALKTEESKFNGFDGLTSVNLAQTACFEPPLANAHVALISCMLPQFLFVYERYSNTEAFIEHCHSHLPTLGSSLSKLPVETVANALTSKSCALDDSYEKLEWFGDAVLKIVQTDTLLKSTELRQWISFLHEGDLSTLRSGACTYGLFAGAGELRF